MKAALKSITEWTMIITLYTVVGIATIFLIIVSILAATFEPPRKLYQKNQDGKALNDQEHNEYYHRYL